MWLALVVCVIGTAAWGQEFAMKRILPASDDGDRTVQVFECRTSQGLTLIAQSETLLSFTITVNAEITNMTASPALPLTVESRGRRIFPLSSLWRTDDAKPAGAQYKITWRYGAKSAKHDEAAVYTLPYQAGRTFYVTQGYGGAPSHQPGGEDEYSLDFSMLEGTVVCAARDGMVVGIKQDSDRGGPDKDAYGNDANYLLIAHADGTTAVYAHLQKNGALVKLGQRVPAGTPIAYSGNTGYSTAPHLHFAVFYNVDGSKRATLPVRVTLRDGRVATLVEGGRY